MLPPPHRVYTVTTSTQATLLRVKSGDMVPVTEPILRIGRDPSCELRVNDRHASRVHAEIRREGEDYVLYDRSANGTWVNGVRVPAKRALATGDKIRVARERFIFAVGMEPEPKREPEASPFASTARVDVVPAPPPLEPRSFETGLRRLREHPLQAWLPIGVVILLAAAFLLLVIHWAT